jgi:hypothetical protein
MIYAAMRVCSLRWVGFVLSVWFVVSGMEPLGRCAEPQLSANEIIQKAVARAQRPEPQQAKSAFAYTKVTLTEEFDASGRVKEHKEKVYQVAFRNGVTEAKLVSVNGKPPGETDRKKQQENDSNARQLLGGPKGGKGDNRENFLTPTLVARFDFSLAGQEVINGRPAYRITFTPKNPAPPIHRLADRLADRISGTVWIDAQEFEVAHAELRLGSEVSFLGGVLGTLKKLAYTMTRTRVADGLWLNTFSSGDFEGRKLLDPMRVKTKSQSSNFHPLVMNGADPGPKG